MICYSDFQKTGDVGALVDYMERNNGEKVPVKTPDGRALSEGEKDRLVERSQQNSFERHLVLSPDPDAEYATEEIDRRTREVVREFQRERPSVEAVYVVHEDEHNHAHIAATGAKRDLTMYADDLERFEERAAEQFREPQRLKQRERHQEAQQELEREVSERHCEIHQEAQLPFGEDSNDQDQGREREYW
jgi:hypothetical protein